MNGNSFLDVKDVVCFGPDPDCDLILWIQWCCRFTGSISDKQIRTIT